MYWIYLALFVLAILTPQFVSGERSFLREEDIEALLIFCFGTFGLMVYLAKEKTFLKVFREKLHLQKQTNMITRDLSDSYSYIGEMNRKLDIVKDLMFDLPKTVAAALGKKDEDLYATLLETVSLLGKTDRVVLCFVHTRKKVMEQVFEKNTKQSFVPHLDPKKLLAEDKFFWEEEDYAVVRSPRQAKGITAFLVFSKTKNHIEDIDVFKILVSQALLVYALEQERRVKQ